MTKEEGMDLNRNPRAPIPKEQWGAFEIGDEVEVIGWFFSDEYGPSCPMCNQCVGDFYCVDIMILDSRKPDGTPVWVRKENGRCKRARCACGYEFIACT